MEKIYTINLYKAWKKVPVWKRPKKSVKAIREFLSRHMKTREESVKISVWLNMEIWKNSIKNPPRKIKVKAIKDEKGIVKVELFEKPKRALKLERKLKEKQGKKEEKKEKGKEERKKEEKMEKEESKESGKGDKEKSKGDGEKKK